MALARLEPILSLADELPYYPVDPYESPWRRLGPRGAVLFTLALVAYWPAVGAGKVFGDETAILRNYWVQTWHAVARSWVHPLAVPEYTPVAYAVQSFQYHLWGPVNVHGYHLISVMLHALTCIPLWLVLRRLEVPGAWLGAAVFAVHPALAQSVAWLGQQGTILAGFLAIMALLQYLRFSALEPWLPPEPGQEHLIDRYSAFALPEDVPFATPERGGLLYAAALVLYVLAALCRPVAAWLPGAVVLLLWWRRGGIDRRDLRALVPFFAVAAVLLLLGLWSALRAARAAPGESLSPMARLLVAGRAPWFYLFELLWPASTLFVYPRWEVNAASWSSSWQYLFPLATAWVLSIIWRGRRRWGKGPVVAAVLFLVPLMPGLGLVANDWTPFSYVADYFLYFSALAAIPAIVSGLLWLLGATGRAGRRAIGVDLVRPLRLAGGVGAVAALGVLAWLQAEAYQDETTLWQDVLAKEPDLVVAHVQLGMTLLGEGKAGAAIEQFSEAVRLHPRDVAAITALGRAYEARSEFGRAIYEYRQALRLEPRNVDLYLSLAAAYDSYGNAAEAERQYEQALTITNGNEALHNNFGVLLANQGRLQDAIAHYHEALRINPRYVAARINLAQALFRSGALKEGAEQLQEAARIDPTSFEAFLTSGVLLAQVGRFPDAERMFRTATKLRPSSADAYYFLGVALAKQGRVSEAVYEFGKAVDLRPDWVEAKQNLEAAKRQSGQPSPHR